VGEGPSILAGRQKVGKTWLAMDWALAVAGGGKAMGAVGCEAGDDAARPTLWPDGGRGATAGAKEPWISRVQWRSQGDRCTHPDKTSRGLDMRIIPAVLSAWAGLTAVLVAAPTIAADAQTPPPGTAPVWSFTAEPFFWGASLDGSVGVRGLPPANVNVDFDQIFNQIDWWPPPVMIDGEARNGDYALFSEFIYLGLEADGSSPGPLNISAEANLNVILWTFGGSYRVVDNGTATLDVLAGGRLWYLDTDLTLTCPCGVREASGSKTWVDPQIGVAGSVGLGSGFGLHAEADVGGFGVGADIDWQVQGTLQYKYNDSVTLEAGYRYLAVDYDNDGFVWDVSMQGPIIGAKFVF
jgi:hypothetical protein